MVIVHGAGKLILLSNNCPPLRKSEIEYYAMLAKIGVHHYNGSKWFFYEFYVFLNQRLFKYQSGSDRKRVLVEYWYSCMPFVVVLVYPRFFFPFKRLCNLEHVHNLNLFDSIVSKLSVSAAIVSKKFLLDTWNILF